MSGKNLAVSSLIQYKTPPDEEVFILRILYLEDTQDFAFVIDINAKKGLPIFKRVSNLAEDLDLKIAKVLTNDPWSKLVKEEELTEKDKKIRDNAFLIVEDLLKQEPEPYIYFKNKFAKAVRKVAEAHEVTLMTVYKYWRKYLQRGQTKNALLPDYQNSGAKGKIREVSKKLGRPKKFRNHPEIGEGVNVDESMKRNFRAGIAVHYHNPKETDLKSAFNLIKKDYFSEDYTFENGIKKPILIPANEQPSYSQFYYFYNKEKDVQKEVESRKGKTAFALHYRPLLGSATHGVFGPGSRYEIDATIADVYLVSRFNSSWIIGRPIIYMVIDVFSRMIAGFYVGLEGPSWLGATMALANTVTDKVKFCAEYGFDITDEEWACKNLPEKLLTDGGELAGKKVETLATNLRVKIETASPYRGDLKGIVERNFRTVQEKVKPFLPGWVIKDTYKRRGQDYRLDAKLDIHQFTKIIIRGILQHNKSFLNYYQRDAEMIKDNVRATPNELWKWGIRNRTGKLRYFDEDIVKLNLLPSDKGKITRGGILFEGMEYSCERAIREGWFVKNSPRNLETVEIVYDQRSTNYVYLREKGGRKFEKCYLLPTEDKYMNKDFYELDNYRDQEQLEQQLAEHADHQEFADHAAYTESVVSESEEAHARDFDPDASKAARVANITDNRKNEKEHIRAQEAFDLGKSTQNEPAAVIPIKPKETPETTGNASLYPSDLAMLAQIRKQKKGGK